jgi:hypothetical protein
VETDSDGDGTPDRIAYFEPGSEEPVRVEQDTDLDGRLDAFVTMRDGVQHEQELDTNADGNVDQWLELAEDGKVARKRQDRDFDGKVDLTVRYDRDEKPLEQIEDSDGDGKPNRVTRFVRNVPREVEEDRNGDGCLDHRQELAADGSLKVDIADTDGNCKPDTWSYVEGGKVVRRELDTNQNSVIDLWEYYEGDVKSLQAESRGRCSRPNVLFIFSEDGQRIVVQEEDRNCNGLPDRLTRFDEAGVAIFQCSPRQRVDLVEGIPAVALEDSIEPHDGYADRRQLYQEGTLTRLEADTNADHRPDVWILYVSGEASIQDEDTDFDGRVDQRFDLAANQPVEVDGNAEPPTLEKFERIGCKGFNGFWKTVRKD